MRLSEIRRYEMLVRVRNFGTTHRDRFPERSVGGQALASVADVVAELSQHAVSQMAATREGRKTKTTAREALLDRLSAIGRTARVVAEDVPGFADPFVRPRRRQPDQALVTTARVFLRDAEPVKEQLIAHGLPTTFLEELRASVERF